DGIRAIAQVGSTVRLWSRLGNEKTRQFPEVVEALERWKRSLGEPVILDGEVVALDAAGNPTGFQNLQGRIHVHDPSSPSRPSTPSRPTVAFIVFDLLREGTSDLRDRPLLDRRAALEGLFANTKAPPILRLSRLVRGDGRELFEEAKRKQWEGLIAKHASSLYK